MWDIRPKYGLFWRIVGYYVGWSNLKGFGPVSEFKTYTDARRALDQLIAV